MFGAHRLSQNLQTIETFEAVPNGRNWIRFEWQRRSRVLCRPSVGSSGSESRSRFPTASRAFSLASWSPGADEDCRRLDGAVGVARFCLTDYQKAKKRRISDSAFQSVFVLEVEGAADALCLVLASKHQPRMARWWRRQWVAIKRGSHCRCGAVTRPQSPCSCLMALSMYIYWNRAELGPLAWSAGETWWSRTR